MTNEAFMARDAARPTSSSLEQIRQMRLARRTRPGETAIQAFLFFCGFITIFTTFAIVFVLGRESLLLIMSEYVDESGQIHTVGMLDFVNTTEWQPHRYEVGIAPLASATLMSSFIAMLVALPLGLGSAIYLSEYASPNVRQIIKPMLEVLAGVPTVAAYKVSLLDEIIARAAIQVPSVILANLVLGENVVPELLQRACTPAALTDMLAPLIADGPERRRQIEAFARLDSIMEVGAAAPSARAAEITLSYAKGLQGQRR
jgi:ABC-type phosphate transport system permease subunit